MAVLGMGKVRCHAIIVVVDGFPYSMYCDICSSGPLTQGQMQGGSVCLCVCVGESVYVRDLL